MLDLVAAVLLLADAEDRSPSTGMTVANLGE
jgi:hypothetical protein